MDRGVGIMKYLKVMLISKQFVSVLKQPNLILPIR